MFILHFMIYNIHKFLLNNFIIIYYIISLKRAFLLQNALAKFQILLILYNLAVHISWAPKYQAVLTCLSEVLQTFLVHREETDSGSILGAHIGNGGPVSDGELGNPRAEKLHKLPHHPDLSQVLQ